MFKHGFPPEWSTLKKLIWLVGSGIAGAASGIWKTVTGTLIHITDALASPVQALSIAIEPLQSGSGDPSPTNVRPITGWTGCNIKRANKNFMILDAPYKIGALSYGQDVGTKYSPGITSEGTYSFENDVATLHNNTAWHGVAIASEPLKSGTYRLRYKIDSRTGSGSADAYDLMVLDKNYVILRKIGHKSGIPSGTFSYTITTTEDGCFVVLDIGGRSSTYVTVKISNIQLEVGTVSTEYQRPNTAVYTATFPATVYYADYDAVNGVLKNYDSTNNSLITIDGTGWTQTTVSSKTAFQHNHPSGAYNQMPFISNYLKQVDSFSENIPKNVAYFGSSKFNVYCPDLTLEEWTALLNETPLQIIRTFHDGSATEYDLGENDINLFAGENNIWADVNDEITLAYQAVPETAFSDETDKGMADYMTLTE